MTLFKLFFIQCLRSKEAKTGSLLIFVLGVISIFLGHRHLERHKEEIAEVQLHQKEHFDRQVELHNEDLGLLLYYAKFANINELSPLSGVSIGQSDVNPTVKKITIKTFEAQRFDTDLVNPMSLQSGNLDLSFVIIYLFPLLIIVLSFNVLSEEIETGSWQLISTQTTSRSKFIANKLFVRFSWVLMVLLALFLTAKFVLGFAFNVHALMIFAISILYILFWFALSFLVISYKKSSGFNALLLLSGWLTLILLIPAGINAYVSSKYPVPEALSTAIAQRDGYHTKWDTDKRATIESFYQHYPQYRSYGYPTDGFNWLWYYAMQQMGDDESQPQQDELNKKIGQRSELSDRISSFIPNMHAQLAFNQLAGTSTIRHMSFLNKIKASHEELRLFFYPKIFEGENADTINWDEIKPQLHKGVIEKQVLKNLLPLLLASLVPLIISIPRAKGI